MNIGKYLVPAAAVRREMSALTNMNRCKVSLDCLNNLLTTQLTIGLTSQNSDLSSIEWLNPAVKSGHPSQTPISESPMLYGLDVYWR